MLDDQQLLRRYVADGSEAAFGELVARYVNLVYSVALRRMGGDTHLAQDVAQLVFTDLARKARSLPEGVVLAGWLHRATRYAAAQLLRTERRRVEREQEAVAMNTLETDTAPDWEQIRPLLDKALDELGRNDRDALLLRFFEQRSLAEVGNALGSNEDAARKRVSRALEKLRAQLARYGITTPAVVLSTVISVNAVQAAPAGLAVTLTSTALAVAAVGTATTFTLLKLITMTKLKTGILCAIVAAGVATPLVLQHQTQTLNRLRDENTNFRQQLDQMAQLSADNERLSNSLAQAKEGSLSDEQKHEVLRLQGEVGRLQKDAQELAVLKRGTQQGGGNSNVKRSYSGAVYPTASSLSQQARERLARMKAKLSLSEEQELAIREILQKRAMFGSQRVQNDIISGKLSPEQISAMQSEVQNSEDNIKALLTAEQLAVYSDFKNDEAIMRARSGASNEVARLSNDLDLSKEQRDTLNAVLGDLYAKRSTGSTAVAELRGVDGVVSADWRKRQTKIAEQWLDEALKALEGILTAEQLETYRDDQTAQLDAMRILENQSAK